jgi:hypothetical protein
MNQTGTLPAGTHQIKSLEGGAIGRALRYPRANPVITSLHKFLDIIVLTVLKFRSLRWIRLDDVRRDMPFADDPRLHQLLADLPQIFLSTVLIQVNKK